VTTLLWRQAGVGTAVGANSAAARTGLTELSSGRLRTNRRGDGSPPYHLRSRQEAQAVCDPGRAGRRGRLPRLAPASPTSARGVFIFGLRNCYETGIVMQNSGSRGCRASASRRIMLSVICSAGFVATKVIAEMDCARVNRDDSMAVRCGPILDTEISESNSGPARRPVSHRSRRSGQAMG
jgi:hypothetical protein